MTKRTDTVNHVSLTPQERSMLAYIQQQTGIGTQAGAIKQAVAVYYALLVAQEQRQQEYED